MIEEEQFDNKSSEPAHTSTFDARKHEVRHEVALPPELVDSYVPLAEWQPDREPARTYLSNLTLSKNWLHVVLIEGKCPRFSSHFCR